MDTNSAPEVDGTPVDMESCHSLCCAGCSTKIDEIHSVMRELKGLEAKVLPILAGMEKNPMLKMFFK